MPLQFTLCDVFGDRPFSGNQLAVFLNGTGVTDDTMHCLAREFAWSEITFVLPRPGNIPRVRIWAPSGELPFAGHPVVGTAVVLAAQGLLESENEGIELGIGRVDVGVADVSHAGGSATMVQRAPTFGAILEDRAGLAAALSLQEEDLVPGLESQIVSTGSSHLMVPVRSTAALTKARAVDDLLAAVLRDVGVRNAYLFTVDTPDTNAAARARLLSFGAEDAATGSAAGSLGAYLVRYGLHRSGTLDIEQGVDIGRPSRISVDVPLRGHIIGPVSVSGTVRIWGHGSVEVAV
jgi:trans-2,3-dihydro-3-hydroxyanthranilate isomerase